MAQKIAANLLGGIHFIVDDVPITSPPARVGQAMLVYLLHQSRPVSRVQLMDWFFQMNDSKRARINLRATLSRIKKNIGDVLEANRVEVWVRDDVSVLLDSQTFGDLSTSRMPRATLQASLSSYHGDFLAGFYLRDAPEFEQWMLVERERLRLLAIEGYQTLLRMQDEAGQFAAALDTTNALLAIEPLLERAQRDKMRLLAFTGQRAGALKHFELAKALFWEELGIALTAETQTLRDQIEANSLVAPKSKLALEIPNNLPIPSTPFIGRSANLTDISDTLAQPDCQLLTLLGPGGIGKSRLAIAAAAAQVAAASADYKDGVYFVPLAAIRDEATLLSTLLATLGVRGAANQPPLEQLTDFLSERSLLLLLDNFEQLTDSTPLLLSLLRAAPQLNCIVTSRVHLDLFEEWIVDVEGMNEVAASELFAGLATRWNRRFSAETNTFHISQICQLTSGIPLALELAAARTRRQDCATIAAQIQASVDYLATQSPSLPARQRTMRAVFDDSWSLLSAEEQLVLSQIAVFRGGFSAEIASALFVNSLPIIEGLVDKSLVQRRPDERFDLHEIVRQYAWERTATANATRSEHGSYFLQRIGDIDLSMRLHNTGSLRDLHEDIDNLRAAWEWATEQQEWTLLEHAAFGFGQSFIHRELHREGIDRFSKTQQLFDGLSDPILTPLNIKLNLYMGRFYGSIGAIAQSVERQRQGMQQAQRHEDAWLLATVAGRLAYALYRAGTYDEARKAAEMAVQISAETNDPKPLSLGYNALGSIAMAQADWGTAEYALKQMLNLNKLHKADSNDVGMAYSNLGYFYNLTGRYETAIEHLERCIAIFEESGYKAGIGYAAINMAGSVARLGQRQASIDYIHLSLKNRREVDDRRGMMACLSELGGIALDDGELAQANAYLQEALQIGAALGAQQRLLTLLAYIVKLQNARADWQTSVVLGGYVAGHPSLNDVTSKLVVPLLEAAVVALSAADAAECKQRAVALMDADALQLATDALAFNT